MFIASPELILLTYASVIAAFISGSLQLIFARFRVEILLNFKPLFAYFRSKQGEFYSRAPTKRICWECFTLSKQGNKELITWLALQTLHPVCVWTKNMTL